jgi:hypothetical protein
MTTTYEIESPIGPKYCDRLSQGLHYVVIVYTQYSQYRGHQFTPRAHYIDMEVVYTQRTPHLDHHVALHVHYISTAPCCTHCQYTMAGTLVSRFTYISQSVLL